MTELFHFGEYTILRAGPGDKLLIKQWIAADPTHAGVFEPSFFFEEEPGVGCYLVRDQTGPLFFLRTANTVRVNIQFGPSHTEQERNRNRVALQKGLDWMAAVCASRGASEIVFDSKNKLLRVLAIHGMGFEARMDDLVRSLEPERSHVTFPEAWRDAPQSQPEGRE